MKRSASQGKTDRQSSRVPVYSGIVLGIAALVASSVIVLAQTSADAPELGAVISRTTVNNLVAPVLVTDRDGNIVDGLQPAQFRLLDNGKEQNIQVDPAYQPISLVVAIEKSARVESVLPQLQKLGTLLTQITGMQGETAILAFDGRIQVPQDFTTDGDKIKVAINNIHAGSTGTRMIDAVERGVYTRGLHADKTPCGQSPGAVTGERNPR
jgi:hypothetical protein